MSSPCLFVVSGPSGSGKTTLVAQLVATTPGIRRAVTATTRAPRPGEKDGVAYHFRTPAQFQTMIDRDEFLEWAEVHGHRYGTPRSEVTRGDGAAVVADLDVQGYRSVRRSGLPVTGIFIAPPTRDTLRERLLARGTETADQLAVRLRRAEVELAAQDEYDHVLVNRDVEESLEELRRLVAGIHPGRAADRRA